MALYHWLDPLWSRVPFPYTAEWETGSLGPVRYLKMNRRYGRWRLMPVYVYAADGVLIDAGMPGMAREVAAFANEVRAREVWITHHHEDHTGNAAALQREGWTVRASEATARMVASPLPERFYEHVLWGKAAPFQPAPLSPQPALSVHPAPGHCPDQVAFFAPHHGWLFTGDAFLGEKIRIFRRDEDFSQTLSTLRALLRLDFDALYCAHRPRPSQGKAALAAKLQWLEDLEGEVHRLHAKGLSPRAIARTLQLQRWEPLAWITAGDGSPVNLVRSILYGPRLRREEIERLGRP